MTKQNKGTEKDVRNFYQEKEKKYLAKKKKKKNGWIFIFAKNIIISFFFR